MVTGGKTLFASAWIDEISEIGTTRSLRCDNADRITNSVSAAVTVELIPVHRIASLRGGRS